MALLSLAQGQARAQDASPASKFKTKVESCFSPPQGATEKAIVSVTLEPDGSLKQQPVALKQGHGSANDAFAKAAVRAIVKCQPYAGLSLQGELAVDFVPEIIPVQSADASAAPEILKAPDGAELSLNVPSGLCRVEPSRGGADAEIWRSNPFARGGADLLAVWIDCDALRTIRNGDRSSPPRQMLSAVEIKRQPTDNPPIPETLKEFVASLVARDKDRYMPVREFLDNPARGGGALVDHDQQAVYYGLRTVDADGTVKGSGVSAYSMIRARPLAVFNMVFRGRNYDEALLSESKLLIESLHASSK